MCVSQYPLFGVLYNIEQYVVRHLLSMFKLVGIVVCFCNMQ